MPFYKDPRPSTENKHQNHSIKDINLLILGTRGVGKSGMVISRLLKSIWKDQPNL